MELTSDLVSLMHLHRLSMFRRPMEDSINHVNFMLNVGVLHYDRETQQRVSAVQIQRVYTDVDQQRKGHFKAFLLAIEAEAVRLNYGVVRVDQVHNEHLLAFLERSGYVRYDDEVAPVMVKRLPLMVNHPWNQDTQ